MGRPTEDKKERTVKLRINEDTYKWLMEQGDNVSAVIRGLIKEGRERPYERKELMDRAVERELQRQAREMEISTHDLYRGLSELINRGKIYYERGRLRTLGALETHDLEMECYKRKVSPQEIVNKLTERLRQE